MQFLSMSGVTHMSCPQPLNKEKLQCKLEMNRRCSTQWGRGGVVTEVNSRNNVSINGFLCHILDIRPGNVIDEEEKLSDDEAPKQLLRERHPPIWTEDDVMN